MIGTSREALNHKVHKPFETNANGTTNPVQGDFFAQQTFHQGALFLRNGTALGAHDKLATAGLALMVLLAIVNMAIFLKLLHSTSWARVSHAHGLLLTSAVSVTVSGQQ